MLPTFNLRLENLRTKSILAFLYKAFPLAPISTLAALAALFQVGAASWLALAQPQPSKKTQINTQTQQRQPERTQQSNVTREIANSRSEKTNDDFNRPTGTGFTLFLGLDGGVMQSNPNFPAKEAAKSGFQVGAKALVSLFTNELALDIGGGYLYNTISAKAGDKSVDKVTGATTEFNNVTIITKAGYFEASPRLRLGEYWQFGPVGQAFFGTDVTFGPEPADKILPTILAGLQLNFVTGKDIPFRFGAQFLTDVNLHERQVYLGLLNLQIGIPIVKPKTIITERRAMAINENIQRQQVDKPVQKIVVKEVVRFLFDSQVIHFETDKAVLSASSEFFLREFARFLNTNPDLWSEITIEGHTDIRGSMEHNMELSRNRAASVRQALVAASMPAGKINSKGFGYTMPLDPGTTEVALARNRRVEMSFEGVSDASRLREAIDRIKNATQKRR